MSKFARPERRKSTAPEKQKPPRPDPGAAPADKSNAPHKGFYAGLIALALGQSTDDGAADARSALTGQDPLAAGGEADWEAAIQEVEDLKADLAADKLAADEQSVRSRKVYAEKDSQLERAILAPGDMLGELGDKLSKARAKAIAAVAVVGGGVGHLVNRALPVRDVIPEPDWAGNEILRRWLAGGGDWDIRDDRRWKDYMMGSERLRGQVFDELLQEVSPNAAGGGAEGLYNFTRRFQATTGVQSATPSGYGYLHGTDRTVGGFEMSGYYSVRRAADGGSVVAVRLNFTWNDNINKLDGADTLAVGLGEALTFGTADSYTIRIHWDSMTLLRYDAMGRMIENYGYPGQSDQDWGKDFPDFDWPPL